MEKDIDRMIEQLKSKEEKKLMRISFLVLFLIVVLVATSVIIVRDLQKVEVLSDENIELRNTSVLIEEKIDSFQLIQERNERAIEMVNDFYTLSKTKRIDSLRLIIADTLDRYYLRENVSRDFVLGKIEDHIDRNPEEVFVVVEDFQAITKKDITSVIGVLSYSKNGINFRNVLAEFRISNEKIFYIRNYEESYKDNFDID